VAILFLRVSGVTVVLVALTRKLLDLLVVPVRALVQATQLLAQACLVRVRTVGLVHHLAVAVVVALVVLVGTLRLTLVARVARVFLQVSQGLLLVAVVVVVVLVTRLLLAVLELAAVVLVETNSPLLLVEPSTLVVVAVEEESATRPTVAPVLSFLSTPQQSL
jgi:hypothetical protein